MCCGCRRYGACRSRRRGFSEPTASNESTNDSFSDMMSYLTLLPLLLPALVILIWQTALRIPPKQTPPTNSTILLLISHPDDEAMFFAPTLLHLTRPSLHNDVRVLCLSSGNADGLGSVRKSEVVHSCQILGVETSHGAETLLSFPLTGDASHGKLGKVVVVDHPDLQDAMGKHWSSGVVSSTLSDVLLRWGGGTSHWKPDIIITFDFSGVSGHSNHVSALFGARHYVSTYHKDNAPPPPRLYTLTSVSLLRKYISILDFPWTFLAGGKQGKHLVFLSDPAEFQKARKAMTDAHVSQMRWFRWAWIWLSRYMVLNDLVEDGLAWDATTKLGAGVDSCRGGEKES